MLQTLCMTEPLDRFAVQKITDGEGTHILYYHLLPFGVHVCVWDVSFY